MKLESVTHIDAPQSVVWGVTEDVGRWPEWTPTIQSVKRLEEGPFDVGSAALIKQPGLPEARWTVTALTRGERFTWQTRVRGIRMIATHELTAQETGTQSMLRIEMTGVVAFCLWPFVRNSVGRALEKENAGLKAKCEALATQGEHGDEAQP